MKVYPMGFTPEIKKRLIAKAKKDDLDFITHSLRTEEELAVIFAKVSRTPGSFEELARSVTEEGASDFHKKWIVSVEGYGHSSVAEHAMLHIAVENVSSLDGDFITDNRLASFTEFSARFKGRQSTGYFIPDAIKKSSRLLKKWRQVHNLIFKVNDDLMKKGMEYIQTDEAKKKFPDRLTGSKVVSDQFKNLLPASRLTSIAVTMNAREAEHLIKKFLSSEYPSVVKLGKLFKRECLKVSPTLVKYAKACEYLTLTRKGLASLISKRKLRKDYYEVDEKVRRVTLLDWDKFADEKVLASALYQDPRSGGFEDLFKILKKVPKTEKENYIKNILGKLGRWDTPIRALEMPNDYLVEYPAMTYGDWREYKRHRIQSYQAKDLDIKWGYMIPPLAYEMDDSKDSKYRGTVEVIKKVISEVEKLFKEVSKTDPIHARYLVTRFHYRPAIAKFNVREAYHLLKLRTSANAHPFIRRLMWPLFDELEKVNPILMNHLKIRLESDPRPLRDSNWSY